VYAVAQTLLLVVFYYLLLSLFLVRKQKTPGFLVLGSFGVKVYLCYTMVSWDPNLISGVRSNDRLLFASQ
jgi:hypothetical protein